MSLKLQPNPTFKSTVAISVPGQEAPAKIGITFRHLSRPQIKDYFGGLEGKDDAGALGEIITGWEGVDAPYSPEALGELLANYPAAAGELFEAFRRDLLDSRVKN